MRETFSDVDARNDRVQAICLKLTELDALPREESRTLEILLTQLETLARRAHSAALVRAVRQRAPMEVHPAQ
jgi:hypothetical protein